NGSTIQVDLAMTWNGVDQGSEWHTFTLPATTGTVTYPTSNSTLNSAWQGSTYPSIPATYFHLVQRTYTVNTSGAVVTIPTNCANFGGCFSLDSRILKAGSKITINSVEYTIASV